MRYRKRQVEIEAIQFTRNNYDEVVEFTNGSTFNFRIERCVGGKAYCDIETLEGSMTATERDYIIKGVHGEFYACKPEIFKETYTVIDCLYDIQLGE